MAKSNVDPHNLVAKKCATELKEKQYYLVKLTTANEIELAGAGVAAYVLAEPAEEGQYGTIVMGAERQKVILGGTVAVGNGLTANSEGKAVKETGEGLIVGVALEAGVAGDIVEALTTVPVTKA